jgi:ribonuclease E
MTKRILVDAAHPEEIRVAVADDSKLLEFDFESLEKKQIKSNIYLGKITRVEPSLQAAFVEYGGNRQGFLPFSEIHFDYYQIPVEDKEKLHKALEAERIKEEQRQQEIENRESRQQEQQEAPKAAEVVAQEKAPAEVVVDSPLSKKEMADLLRAEELAKQFALEIMGEEYYNEKYGKPAVAPVAEVAPAPVQEAEEIVPEEDNNVPEERSKSSMEFYKKYKIQEVIKRNQIVLVQIVKEERGSKGASLTTYLALAGRYCVFMPNTDKGGGVSRRISNFTERRRIRDVIKQLNTPFGTSVIIRTAGMEREVDDIKKDYDYLLSVWDTIRKQTLESSAPALIYEESDIVKRSLRDMLKGDVSEVYIEGEETFKSATRFMEIIGPNQVGMIKHYSGKIPVFQKFKIEEKLDELYEPEIKLESGGSIVITPTEALVSIDVNSGKATKERSVEDTALKTNIEAAREIARQLKLRDLAGLVVIDFIDMREVRNRKAVERELKDALKADKAKIQIGRISAFGLLEMSRQRLRSSIVESSSGRCPMCKGIGVARTTESLTLKAVRAIEAEAGKRSVKEIFLRVSQAIAHNIEEHRKKEIAQIEKNDDVKIIIEVDALMLPNQFEISTHKFASKHDNKNKRSDKPHHTKHEKGPARPQQDVAPEGAAIPSESEIDADVDEQLSAWQSEVADVEKIATRRYDSTAPEGEPAAAGGERGDNRGNGGGYKGDRDRRNNRGGGRNGDRNRGGRNRNNRRGPGGGRPGGPRNRYNNNNNSNYNGDSFGNEQNDVGNYQPPENVERIDSYKPEPRTERTDFERPAAENKPSQQDKAVDSKLKGLWKKITS